MGKALPLEFRLGFASRFAEALRIAGYITAEGSPEITRFAREKGWKVYNVSRWLTGVIPRHHEIMKLASDLGTSPGQLAYGEPPLRPTMGDQARKLLSAVLVALTIGGVPAIGRTMPLEAHGPDSAHYVVPRRVRRVPLLLPA